MGTIINNYYIFTEMRFTFAVVCLLGFTAANRLVGEPGTEKIKPEVPVDGKGVPELAAAKEAEFKKAVDDKAAAEAAQSVVNEKAKVAAAFEASNKNMLI